MGKKKKNQPSLGAKPSGALPKLGADPVSYKTKHPVWRFHLFDWDGPWGLSACLTKDWRKHVELHLANLETMTWAAIEQAAGGKPSGTNSHPLSRDKFSRDAKRRLDNRSILSDSFFSLRLENTVRIYGIREDNCLKIIWFDPFHFSGDPRAAYGW
jgi:hypothetical protein